MRLTVCCDAATAPLVLWCDLEYSSERGSIKMCKNSPAVSLLAALAVLFAPSCATLIHGGGQQTVSIATDPTGAKVQVGGQSLVSPAEITLSRDHDYQVVATKEGYDQSITAIHSRFSWVTVLDLIFIIPWVIDLVSGGGYYLEPDTLQMTLSPATQSNQAQPQISPRPAPAAAPNPNTGDQWRSPNPP